MADHRDEISGETHSLASKVADRLRTPERLPRGFDETLMWQVRAEGPSLYPAHGEGAWWRGVTYEQDGYRATWRGIYDDHGRLMVAICHNMDLGDSWEHADDPQYPEKFSALGIRIAVNYITYAMTH